MSLHILVFGQSGQVATKLAALTDERTNITTLDRNAADLSDPAACAAAITKHGPDGVINAAAYTAVDKAEDEEAQAQIINGDAPAAMAQACAALDIPFVHISTDYVFDGSGTDPWPVDAPTGPLGAYGRTKLAGEEGVRRAGGTHAILRTAWVFSEVGNNFVKTMLRLSETRDTLNVVDDQIGGPTDADAIARSCVEILRQLVRDPSKSGTYHFAGMPYASWAAFATAIFTTANRDMTINGIPSSDYPTPAARPSNSRLDCSSLTAAFGLAPPEWQTGLDRVIVALNEKT